MQKTLLSRTLAFCPVRKHFCPALTRSSRSSAGCWISDADYSDQQQTARCRCGCRGWTRQWWTDAWDGTCSASTGCHCHYSVSAMPLRRLRAYQMHALEQGRWDAFSALGQETQADLRRFSRDHRGWRRHGDWSHQYIKNSASWGENGFDGGGELGHEALCRRRRGAVDDEHLECLWGSSSGDEQMQWFERVGHNFIKSLNVDGVLENKR